MAEGSELERLQTTRHRTQHFRCAKHWSRLGHKHYLHLTALTQRFGKREQATRQRDDLQFAGDAPTVLESKNGGSNVCKVRAWRTLFGVRLREERHVQSMCRPREEQEITEGAVLLRSVFGAGLFDLTS